MDKAHDYKFEQALRGSIKQDILRFANSFTDPKDVEQAIKIIQQKN